MTSRTDREWQKWGASDPYYGVLGQSTQSVSDPEVRQRFMATGAEDLDRAMTDVETLFGPIPRGRSLDFGCGVGRIMAAMLDEFDHVTGIDISDHMIAEARKNLAEPERTSYFNSTDQIPVDERGYDFVHSFIVIQHIRPAQGIPLIRSLIELVKPGGMFSLHFTIADYRTGTRLINYFRYRMKALHVLSNLLRGRRLDEPVMEMNRYPVWKVLKETADLCGSLYGVRFIDQDGPLGFVLMGKILKPERRHLADPRSTVEARMSLKIVHWAKFYPPEWGGTELVNFEQATASAAHGDDVTVVAFTRADARSEVEGGVKVVRAKVAAGIDSQPLSWRWFTSAIREARGAEVLHIHTPNLLAAAALLFVSRRTRIILQWHTDLVDKGLLGRLARPLEIYMAHRAETLIASSSAYAQASPILRGAGRKTRAIPLGIPDPAIVPASPELPAAVAEFVDGRPYALAVGRSVPYKGFEYLIEAAARMQSRGAIVIVGTGPLEPLYRKLIADHGLEDRVLLTGRVGTGDLSALFGSAALYVMSSVKRSEAFGIVTLEAMGHSLPVVATQIEGSGVAWVAGDGETGPIVPPRDPETLARAIDGLLADPAARMAFGKAARARYERLFTRDRMIGAVLALYEAPGSLRDPPSNDPAERSV